MHLTKTSKVYITRLKVSREFDLNYFDCWVKICIKNFFVSTSKIPVKPFRNNTKIDNALTSYFPNYKDYINIPKSTNNAYKFYPISSPTSKRRYNANITLVKDIHLKPICISLMFFKNGHLNITKYGYLALVAQGLKIDEALLSKNQKAKIEKQKRRYEESGILAIDVFFNSCFSGKNIFALPIDFYSRFRNYFFQNYYGRYLYKDNDEFSIKKEYEKFLSLI